MLTPTGGERYTWGVIFRNAAEGAPQLACQEKQNEETISPRHCHFGMRDGFVVGVRRRTARPRRRMQGRAADTDAVGRR